MKKYLTALFLIALLFFLTGQQGCSLIGGSGEVKQADVHKGYDGLVMNFLKDSPPSKMYEETDFKIALELRNKGTCDVGPSSPDYCNGYIEIEGFDTSVIKGFGGFGSYTGGYTGIFTQEVPNIPGRSIYNLEGGYDIITFPSKTTFAYAILPEVGPDSLKQSILATACYTYKTDSTATLCIDPDPYGVQIEDKVCTMKDVTLSGGQGAPIAVTKVEPSIITSRSGGPQYIQFKIFVQKGGTATKTSKEGVGAVGKGIVIHPSAVFRAGGGGCAKPDYINLNRIVVSGELSGVPFFKCQPDPWEVTLDSSGKGFIICRTGIPSSGSAYFAPLHITLNYGYINTVSTTTEIVQMP